MRSSLLRSLVLLPLTLSLSFCTPSRRPGGVDWGFYKQPDAEAACLASNLSQWELKGPFIHSMLRCASNKDDEGNATLPATQALLATLGPDELQRLLDFLHLTDPRGQTHEEKYPYLLAFASVLDRDLSVHPDLKNERLETLQGFLLSLETERSQKLLAHWSRSGRLSDLLRELGLLLEGLRDHSLSALTRELLAGDQLRTPLLQLSRPLLADDLLMASVERSLSSEPTLQLSASEQAASLERWRQPLETEPASPAPAADAPSALLPAAHVKAYADALPPSDWAKLSDMLLVLWRAYRTHSPGEQASLDERLIAGLEHAIDQQKAPSLWLLSLASDLKQLKARDFKDVSAAVERLLGEDYDATLDTLRAKIGASRLMELTASLLTEGGSVPSCGELRIEGMGQAQDFTAYAALLQTLSRPHPACGGSTPLEAALAAWTQCSGGACASQQPRAAPPIASYWADDYQVPSPEVLRPLLQSTLTALAAALNTDPYTLKNRGLAPGAVEPTLIVEIAKQLRDAGVGTLEQLAAFDLELNRQYKGRLSADFLEQVLATRLENLASLASQFHDLVPESSEASEKLVDQRVSRILAGVYSRGPIEAALAERLQPQRVLSERLAADPSLQNFFAAHPAALSWFLERQRRSESIFRYPEFATQANEDATPFASLGSNLQNYVSFDASEGQSLLKTQAGPEVVQPSQAIQNFDPYDRSKLSAWGLWSQQLTSSSLVSKDMPPALSQSFETWSRDSWLPALSDPLQWSDLSQKEAPAWAARTPQLSAEFFDVETYSVEEARILSLYVLRHYLKIPSALPEASVLSTEAPPTANSTNIKTPLRGFMNAAYMASPGNDYSLFVRLFPALLRDPSKGTLEALQGAALPSLEEISEGFPYVRQNLIRDVGNLQADTLSSSFRLFSTFNLLSFTRAGIGFFPQPLIGYGGKLCRVSATETSPCPLELQAADETAALSAYQSYISSLFAQHLCPLLQGHELGAPELWQQRLGLQIVNPTSCQTSPRLVDLPADPLRFPTWLTRWILSDVFTMGKSARLKPGLAQIPAALRYYKLQNQAPPERAARWLRESVGVWHNTNAASQSRRQFFASSFWAGAPSLLGSLIDAEKQKLDADAWKQALIALAERDSEGNVQDTLRQLLKRGNDAQARVAASDGSALMMLLEMVRDLQQQPEELRLLGYMLSDYTSAESYDFAGNDLPLAVLGLFEDRFSWQDPALRFTKFVAQRETLQAWAQIGRSFSPQELTRFFETSAQALAALGSTVEQERLLQGLLNEGLSLGQLWQSEQKHVLAQSWDQVLKRWRDIDWGADYRAAWVSGLLAKWSTPLLRLDGEVGPSLEQQLEPHLAHLLARTPSLIAAHQASGPLSEALFWPRLLTSMLKSIEEQPEGARAAASWLGSAAFAFDDSARWQRLFLEDEARATTSAALSVMSSIAEDIWRAAALESSDLLSRLEKPLHYLQTRLIWHLDPDHNAFRRSLDHLYKLASDAQLNLRQHELLARWLGPEPHEEATATSNP